MAGELLLDRVASETDGPAILRRLLFLILACAAMVGLFGQEIAFAAGSALKPHAPMSAAMPDSCMDAMGTQPAKAPCKGLTLDCIAAMGCVVPLLPVDAPGVEPSPLYTDITPAASPMLRLAGRAPPPEPEPPARLI